MNFYRNIYDQRIFNYNALISYIAGYISFMKSRNNIKNETNSWKNQDII